MKCPASLCEAMVVLSLYKKRAIGYTQHVANDVYVDDVDDDEAGACVFLFCTVDQWMGHSQSAVSRTSLSTACRMLRESVSRTMFSTECLNAEPFKRGPQCLPCVESSNALLHDVLTKGSGHQWTE